MYCSSRMKDLPSADRPREKVGTYGTNVLTLAELLAILIETGSQGRSSLDLAGDILRLVESAGFVDTSTGIRSLTLHQLMQIKGIGKAKATKVLAAIELGKRLYGSAITPRVVIDDPSIAANCLAADLMWQHTERFAIVALDVKHRILGKQVVSIGTATETLAHPREIFRAVLGLGGCRVIVAHNHPSGNLEQSPEDVQLTRQLLKAGQVMGIPLLDHLILGNGDFASLRERTSLWNELPQE